MAWLCLSRGLPKKPSFKSIALNHCWHSVRAADRVQSRAAAGWTSWTVGLFARSSCTDLCLSVSGFWTGKTGVLYSDSHSINKPNAPRISLRPPIPLPASDFKGYRFCLPNLDPGFRVVTNECLRSLKNHRQGHQQKPDFNMKRQNNKVHWRDSLCYFQDSSGTERKKNQHQNQTKSRQSNPNWTEHCLGVCGCVWVRVTKGQRGQG